MSDTEREHTPTTSLVRDGYAATYGTGTGSKGVKGDFDRWLAQVRADERERVRGLAERAIRDHVKHMRSYTIHLDQMAGWDHAMNLLERDADMIAANIARSGGAS